MSEEANKELNQRCWEMFEKGYPKGDKKEYGSVETTPILRKYFNSNQEDTLNSFQFESLLIEQGYQFNVIAGEKHWYIK